MAVIAGVSRLLKNYSIAIGTNNYEQTVNSVQLTPTSTIVTAKGGTPTAIYQDMTTPTWTCDISWLQDWETANSLSQYFLTNMGKTATFVFKPYGTGPSFAFNAIVTAGPVGGAMETFGSGTVSLAIIGAPVFTTGTVTP